MKRCYLGAGVLAALLVILGVCPSLVEAPISAVAAGLM